MMVDGHYFPWLDIPYEFRTDDIKGTSLAADDIAAVKAPY